MERHLRLPGVLAVLAIAAVLPATAAAQGRLSRADAGTVSATFEKSKGNQKAEIAVSVRNNSDVRGQLRVRLVYDDGTTVRERAKRKRPKHVGMKVGTQNIDVWLGRRAANEPQIGRRDVKRIKVQAWADELPKTPLTGTLIMALRTSAKVSPLAVPVKLSPPAETVAPKVWHDAKVEPETIVMTVKRWWPAPFGRSDELRVSSADLEVSGAKVPPGTSFTQLVGGDSGGRGTVELAGLAGDTDTLRVSIDKITRYGTYEAKFALDEADTAAPAVTVKIEAADFFIWPLIVLLIGAGLAYLQLRATEVKRPKRVLQHALKRLQRAHADDHDTEGPVPYDLDVFPKDWNDCADPQKEAHQLYCRIGTATLKEELDDIQKSIADLDARVTLWPVSRAKVARLVEARKSLPGGAAAAKMRETAKGLEKRATAPSTEAATKAYQKEVDAQVEAIQTWIAAWRMLRQAERIHRRLRKNRDRDQEIVRRHNPGRWEPDLVAAGDGDELERCGVFDGLCRDLHVLRSLDLTPPPPAPAPAPAPEEIDVVVTVPNVAEFQARVRPLDHPSAASWMFAEEPAAGEGDGEDKAEGAADGEQTMPEIPLGPSHLTPAPSISAASLEGLKAADLRNFLWTAAIGTLVYFLGIYDDTYGSLTQYLTAFAAGAGTMYVANYKLLPWFQSYRLPKAP